ncbi:MAG: serine dehydratase beta chain, partial [Steroidobacteraceae bacterium]
MVEVSVFDLFRRGIGPSSSHTMGPMEAARRFVSQLRDQGLLAAVGAVQVDLYGSLALTGRGHGTDRALLCGLEGHDPVDLDPDLVAPLYERVVAGGPLALAGTHAIRFDLRTDLREHPAQRLPRHANGLRFTALDASGQVLASGVFYSVGGGVVLAETECGRSPEPQPGLPHPFASAAELVQRCEQQGLSIDALQRANECYLRPEAAVDAGLDQLWQAMRACVERGFRAE